MHNELRHFISDTMDYFLAGKDKQQKKKGTTQAARCSLHQSRKQRHIGQKCRESPLPMERITSGDLEGLHLIGSYFVL